MPERTKEVGVRLSVKDADVAKRALAAFGKEGEDALKHIEQAGRKANPGLAAVSTTIQRSKEYARDFGREVFTSIVGPLAAVGTAAGAIQVLGDALERVKRIADFGDVAERLGIEVGKLQGLDDSFKEMGNDAGQLNSGLQTFAVNLSKARTEGGKLSDVFKLNGKTITGDMLTDLKTFADLVKNARTEQDKLALTTLAFGKGNKEIVDFISQGGEAVGHFADEAERLNSALSAEDVAKAKDVAEHLAEMNIRLDAARDKFALLIAPGEVWLIERFDEALGNIVNNLGAVVHLLQTTGVNGIGLLGPMPQGGPAQITVQGGAPETPVAPTGFDFRKFLDPHGPATRLPNAGDHAADQQAKRINDVTEALKLQLANLGLSNRAQQIANELAKAHVAALSEDGKEIVRLTSNLYDQKAALDAINEAQTFLATSGADLFDNLIDGTESWQQSLVDLGKTLAKAVIQAELLGDGPLAGILGTKSDVSGEAGGAFGAIAKALLGALIPGAGGGSSLRLGYQVGVNADGTDNWRGGPTWVGEKGPEIVNLPRGAQVIPNHALGGTTVNLAPTYNINGSGLNQAQLAAVLDAHDQKLLKAVPGAVKKSIKNGGFG